MDGQNPQTIILLFRYMNIPGQLNALQGGGVTKNTLINKVVANQCYEFRVINS